MAVFGGLVLTNAGMNMLARAQAGEELKIKRIALRRRRIINTKYGNIRKFNT